MVSPSGSLNPCQSFINFFLIKISRVGVRRLIRGLQVHSNDSTPLVGFENDTTKVDAQVEAGLSSIIVPALHSVTRKREFALPRGAGSPR